MEQVELLTRYSNSDLDKILGHKFPVLSDGFIRVIDYMGGDESIVQAARVSYGKGTKQVSENEGLIRYLMRHNHSTPSEMCVLKIHVRMPMDCMRQFVRHRNASLNEYSTRYSEAIDSCDRTLETEWRSQSGTNKQGSADTIKEWPKEMLEKYGEQPIITPGYSLTFGEAVIQKQCREEYERRLKMGVSREQARKDLPLSTYTEAYWKIDLHNLLHFLGLRMDSHAQKEIRDYANIIGNEIVARWVPMTWRAFNDYHIMRNAMKLTSRDIEVIQAMGEGSPNTQLHWNAVHVAGSFGWLEKSEKTGKLKSNRERDECESKLIKLGLEIPWQSFK
jgi:thymidylate synthase (FAD)